MKVAGKVAIVFGGARGIGHGYVHYLLQNGAKVCIGDIKEDVGKETEKEFTSKYPGCIKFVRCDISQDQDVKDVFEASKCFGQVEICVNAAGIQKEFGDTWKQTIDVNYGGTVRITYTAFDYMGKDKGGLGGVVIHTASICGLKPFPYSPVYGGTKWAIIGFVKAWGVAHNYERLGVRVNVVCPCAVDTPLQYEAEVFEAQLFKDRISNIPRLSKYVCADAMLQLIEDDSMNGQTLVATATLGVIKDDCAKEMHYENIW